MTYKQKKLQEFREKFLTAWPHDELMSSRDALAFLESTIDEMEDKIPFVKLESYREGYNEALDDMRENIEFNKLQQPPL